MEDIDRLIIGLLCADGRMSLADIARETRLSTSALHQRVRRELWGYAPDEALAVEDLIADLVRSGAATRDGPMVHNAG